MATEPTTPDPAPPPVAQPAPPEPAPPAPAISAQPKTAPAPEAIKALPKLPCRARVCPEWKTEPKLVVEPRPPLIELVPEATEERRFGISRAGTSWRGEKPKVRIQKLPQAEAPK